MRNSLKNTAYWNNSYPLKIQGIVQNYFWGQASKSAFIPDLLGCASEGKPWAELWYGIHPKAPSTIELNNNKIALSELFPEIPWLLKILSAAQMISVQAHPNMQQAINGFTQEKLKQVPDEERCYKDRNLKLEVLIPLTEFWMLVDFAPKEEILKIFKRFSELENFFSKELTLLKSADCKKQEESSIRELYTKIMYLPQEQINMLLMPIIKKLREKAISTEFRKTQKEYWILKAADLYCDKAIADVGIFNILLLNLLKLPAVSDQADISTNFSQIDDTKKLKASTAIYTDSGTLHCYLEGTGIEHMTNSDNVIRAGLTLKHKDTIELLKIINYKNHKNMIINPLIFETAGIRDLTYKNPSKRFQTTISFQAANQKRKILPYPSAPQIILVLSGKITINWKKENYIFNKGECVLIPPAKNMNYTIQTAIDSSYVRN